MIRTYDDDFVQQVKDLAALGLTPTQIASRLDLIGEERRAFLFHITQEKSPLGAAYIDAYAQFNEDINAALVALAVSGDTDAIELQMRAQRQREYDTLCEKLFGI